ERRPPVIHHPAVEPVEPAVDGAGHHLEAVVVGVAVDVPALPVPERREPFPRVCEDRVRVFLEIRGVWVDALRPFGEGAIIGPAGEMEWSPPPVSLAVAVLGGRVAELLRERPGVVFLLLLRRPPDFRVPSE